MSVGLQRNAITVTNIENRMNGVLKSMYMILLAYLPQDYRKDASLRSEKQLQAYSISFYKKHSLNGKDTFRL